MIWNVFLQMLRRIVLVDHVFITIDFNFTSIYLPTNQVDLGHELNLLLIQMLSQNKISTGVANAIKRRCQQFLITACKELKQRLPQNMSILKKIKHSSPSFCLNYARKPFSELPLELANNDKISILENQWRMLLTIDWESIFLPGISQSGPKFWLKAVAAKNAGGDLILKDLALFALKVYSLPISNAAVEPQSL